MRRLVLGLFALGTKRSLHICTIGSFCRTSYKTGTIAFTPTTGQIFNLISRPLAPYKSYRPHPEVNKLTPTSSCFFIRLQIELISDLSIHHSCLVFPVTYTASPSTWCFSLSH